MIEFIGWPSIESFYNILKKIRRYPELMEDKSAIKYRGKIKLHGTNAAVQIVDGEVAAQSRNNIITPLKDNAGFASWVHSTKSHWLKVRNNMIIYGEWAGNGVQKGVAISKIPDKIFAVFAAKDLTSNELITEPSELEPLVAGIPRTYVLPWYSDEHSISWFDDVSVQSVVDKINGEVEVVEKCDPWVKDTFGIEGIGEGLVYYPINVEAKRGSRSFSDYGFKAKGESHRVTKSDTAIRPKAPAAAGIDEFVELVVTEARLEQGVSEIGGVDIKNTGKFMGWVSKDVLKESESELEESKLQWTDVSKAVGNRARNWYINKCKQV